LLHRIWHPFLPVLLNSASLIKPGRFHFSHVHSARKHKKQFLNITMHGSVPRVDMRSRPPRSHLLTQPRQSGSRPRSVRVNQAHMVHESNSFGEAQRVSGSGVRRLAKPGEAWKGGPLGRKFSARSSWEAPTGRVASPWCGRMMQAGN
jgi:hypothetical protein